MSEQDDGDARSLSAGAGAGRSEGPCSCMGARDDAAWRVVSAECCGAALLVLLTCLAGCGPGAAASPLYRALASGLVVAALVQSVDHVSGAMFNPAVTLAALVWGRVRAARAGAVVLAQLAGGALLAALQPRGAALCVTAPAAHVAPLHAALLEALLAGCLALANCGSWDARTHMLRDSWPLRIGLVVTGLSLVGGELTGASMNPARSFGPALWSGNWTHHWVYWVGPLSGSLLFTLLYCAAWRARGGVAPPPTLHAVKCRAGP